jgi:hypothetical protein
MLSGVISKASNHTTPKCENVSGEGYQSRTALRREQQEQVGNNHNENQATGKKGNAEHGHHRHNPWKVRNGGTHRGYLGHMALRWEKCGM